MCPLLFTSSRYSFLRLFTIRSFVRYKFISVLVTKFSLFPYGHIIEDASLLGDGHVVIFIFGGYFSEDHTKENHEQHQIYLKDKMMT